MKRIKKSVFYDFSSLLYLLVILNMYTLINKIGKISCWNLWQTDWKIYCAWLIDSWLVEWIDVLIDWRLTYKRRLIYSWYKSLIAHITCPLWIISLLNWQGFPDFVFNVVSSQLLIDSSLDCLLVALIGWLMNARLKQNTMAALPRPLISIFVVLILPQVKMLAYKRFGRFCIAIQILQLKVCFNKPMSNL